MMTDGFSNSSMKPLRSNKPHIAFIDGYWRVSPMPAQYLRTHAYLYDKWQNAHRFVYRMNKLHDMMIHLQTDERIVKRVERF